jgi:hypothetical protein
VAAARGPICLYAVVPADEAGAACDDNPGLRGVACGPIAGLVGRRRGRAGPRAALHHDRIIGRALGACSAVMPFRFGIEVRSEPELRGVLEINLDALSGQLARVRGRVEMGLKVKLPPSSPPERWSSALARVRALAPWVEDRRERLLRLSTGQALEGCYLVSREDVSAFWTAVEEIRAALAGLPVLGSGPWAAYSFCDLALRHAGEDR